MTDLLGKEITQRAPKGSIPRWSSKYGYSERSVKKFLDIGRKGNEAPPFDYPERMEEWGGRHLPQITRRFRAGIEKAMGGSPANSSPGESEPAQPPSTSERIELPEVLDSDLGMENQLHGYRREFAMLAKLRENALTEGNFSRANNYFDQQQKVSSEIRQLEKALPLILEQRGIYQKTADVQEHVGNFLNILKRSLLNRESKAAVRLREATTDQDMKRAWKEEIEAVFRECCENSFGEKLTLE